MALVDRRWQRTATLCALYFAQGLPWGFMATAVIVYLTRNGVSTKEAGYVASFILLPWTFKLVWAPLIDTVTIRSMGRRRAWIIGAELLMALTLLGFLFMGDLTRELKMLAGMFFLHNCFASLQDVCTDALAVDVLPFEEQGRANGLMWGTKLVGKGLGASVMARVMVEWGLPAAVMLQFAVLVAIMLFPLLILERRGEKRFPWSDGAAVRTKEETSVKTNVRSMREIGSNLLRAFSLTTTAVFVAFTLLKIVGTGVNEIVTKAIYTDQKKLDWEVVEFSDVEGMYAIGPMLLGALLGGYLANRFGRRTILIFGYGGYAAAAIVFALTPELWHQRWYATTYILLTQGLGAVGSVGFLSMAMRITWTNSAATMFTIYMALSNVSHVSGKALAGAVSGAFGDAGSFWFVGISTLLPLLLLKYVNPEDVDEFKFARPAPDAEATPAE